MLPMLTTRPRAFFTSGRKIWVTNIIPQRLTSAMLLKLSSVCHSTMPTVSLPALFTSPHSPVEYAESSEDKTQGWLNGKGSILNSSNLEGRILWNPGLQRGRDGKGETGSGKKVGGGEGKGKRKGEALGSFSIQIISRSITFLSRYWPHF